MFTFGIEHEVAFLRADGQFASFHSTTFAEFAAIIERLPIYKEDYPFLRVGRSGIRQKRWYVEGFERHDAAGRRSGLLPKGIEIRTTPQSTIRAAVEELTMSFLLLRDVALSAGFVPVLTSFHPYCTEVVPDDPFNTFEAAQLQRSASERSALFSLLSYGPDLNISSTHASTAEILDVGRKYTFYCPYILPFTYSAPFYSGALWDGLSVRTFLRILQRPVTNVFLAQRGDEQSSHRALVKLARIPAEIGRVEFKACDSCDDFALYGGLLALLKGLWLDRSLPGRADLPDIALHQLSARQGFAQQDIVTGAQAVLAAAAVALVDDEDIQWLDGLRTLLTQRRALALAMREAFYNYSSIDAVLLKTYMRYR
ncbi:hypothetical protein ccbrp13_29450 [Ktedonobacteria bacterium brp13]|nr:hypothetical protein ccbrp13_29450 [Ktedonobacteria bacterium brp13]